MGGAFVYHFTLREDLHYFMRNRACNQYFHSFHSRNFHSQLFQDLFSFLYKPFPIPSFRSYHTVISELLNAQTSSRKISFSA